MGDDLQDLINFLKPSTRADVRGVAVQQLLGMTGSVEGCQYITQHSALLESVLHLLSDNNTSIKKDAGKMLINLTAEESSVPAFLHKTLECSLTKVISELLEECMDTKLTNTQLCCILTNLSRTEDGARFMAKVVMESECMGLAWFVGKLCDLYAEKGPPFSALSTLLMNLTQVPGVRRGLMEAPGRLLLRLLPLMSLSGSLGLCKGIVGSVQNCCFEYDFHSWLLGEEVDLLPRLLLPLTGPEEFDEDDMDRLPLDLQYLPDTKLREPDPEVRAMLIKAVNKLCSTKAGRAYIKEKNVYVIFRELHKWEQNEENIDSIMNVVDILIGEEPTAGMEELHNVDIPSHVEKSFLQETQGP